MTGCSGVQESATTSPSNQELQAGNPDWTSLDDAELREYFYTNAPLAWERYRSRLSQFRVEYELGEPILLSGEYFINGRYEMFHLADNRIVGQNPDYQFSIVKKDGESWELESFRRMGEKKEREIQFGFVFDSVPLIVQRLLMVHNASLPELVKSKSFEIQKISVVEIEGEPFVRIDFTGDFGAHEIDWKVGNDPIVQSYVILDPENHWIINGAAVYDETKTGIIADYTADFSGSVPVPMRYFSVWDYDSAGGGWKEGPTIKSYKFHFEQTSLFDFHLSAYGVEEPNDE